MLRIKETGTLANGKRADFVVLNANPLEEIRNTRTIDSVNLEEVRLGRDALREKFKPDWWNLIIDRRNVLIGQTNASREGA